MDRTTVLEAVARSIVEDGQASPDLELALERLRADRANGERLEEAVDELRRAVLGCAAEVARTDGAGVSTDQTSEQKGSTDAPTGVEQEA